MYIVNSGIRDQTVDNMMFDTARIYFARDLTPLDDPSAVKPLTTVLKTADETGISRGGSTFTIQFEYRQPEFDQSRGEYPIKKLMRVNPMLTGNFLEIDRTNMVNIVPSMRATPMTNGLTKYTVFKELAQEDYLENLLCVASHGQRELPVIIAFKKVLNQSEFNLEMTDGNEPVIASEFMGIYDLLDDSIVPVSIYTSNEAGIIMTLADSEPTVDTSAGTVDLTANVVWVDGYSEDIQLSVANDPHNSKADFLPSSVVIDTGDVIEGSGQTTSHTITLDTSGVSEGTYSGFIRYQAPRGLLDYLPFILTVTAA